MRIIQIGDRKIALREVSVLILLEWIAYFVSRVVSSRWSDCGAKSGKTRRHDRIAVRAFGSLQRSPGAFLQMALLAPFWGHSYPNTQKVDKMVGKNLISGPLTVLRRPVYASGHYKRP